MTFHNCLLENKPMAAALGMNKTDSHVIKLQSTIVGELNGFV
jgi:hypothetical protein